MFVIYLIFMKGIRPKNQPFVYNANILEGNILDLRLPFNIGYKKFDNLK